MKRLVDSASLLADPGFAGALITWQKQYGRHQLPWQNTRDAYRVWLSEIMLQQTQVRAVIPYYQRFLQSFPDVAALAAANQEQVMAHWSGLGYYSRARNLHRCAREVVAQHGGVFPSDPQVLVSLPGIGRSTAAAIAAFSFGARAAILDGNVKRVFCRTFGIEGFPSDKRVENLLWQQAEALLPDQDIESYTQGLMDLGATLCTRSRPLCGTCPLQVRCVALATDRVAQLPMRKPKKAIPEKSTTMLVVVHDDEVLLEQRGQQGIWGGLLSLPEMNRLFAAEPEGVTEEVLQDALSAFGELATFETMPDFSHGFTHYKLQITPVRVQLARRFSMAGQLSYQWVSMQAISDAPLPAPVKKMLLSLG